MTGQQYQNIVRSVAAAVALALSSAAALAQAADGAGRHPDGWYLQLGRADHTTAVDTGATWDWAWRHKTLRGEFGGYWDLSLGAWRSEAHDGHGVAWNGRLGLTPVLRYTHSRWFVEAGIGLNVIAPHYRSGDERFSTNVNFGDHVGFGRRFGADGSHEVSLRLQHYSNADIDQPNPGVNFLQLRYLHRY